MALPASFIVPRPVIGSGSEIEQVFDINIFGRSIVTTVAKHPNVVRRWIEGVNNNNENVGLHYFGLEIELENEVGTLQLCDGNRCLIFQLMNWPCPSSLNNFFGDYNNVFVSHGLGFKIRKLRQKFEFEATAIGLDHTGFFTATVLRRNFGLNVRDLREGKKMLLKSIVLQGTENNWCRPNLTIQQVQYACADAFLNVQILRWLGIISPN